MTLEDRIRQALQSVGASMQSELQSRLEAVRTELMRAAEEDRMAAEADASSTLAAEIAAVRAEADERAAAETARVRAEADERVAAETARAHDEVRQSAAAESDRLRHNVDELRAAADHARQETEQATLEIASAQARAAAAEQALEDAKSQQDDAFAAHAVERQEMMACIDRLVTAIRRIDAAASLSDVLNALSEGASRETARTAVFVGAGDTYQVYRLSGFEDAHPTSLPKQDAGNLSRGLPFAPLPPDREGFAFPVSVGGQPVALIYADHLSGEAQAVPSPWPELVEILARSAAARLETLTAARTVQALGGARPAAPVATIGAAPPPSTTGDDQSARRYARLLVSEIKLYNESAVRAGREHRDLLERLRPEIQRARRLYEERVPSHVAGRTTYFDDELVQTLADGDPSALGRKQ